MNTRLLRTGFLLLWLSLGLAGCARNYTIVTNGGQMISARGKPHYDRANAVFVYTDPNGRQRVIPAGSVSQVAPASEASSQFKFTNGH